MSNAKQSVFSPYAATKMSPVKRLAICGILTAMATILSAYLKVPLYLFGVYTVKISFDIVAIAMVAALCGPVYSAIAFALSDVLAVLLVPMGAINPLITFSCFLIGLVLGLFFARGKKISFLRLLLAIAVPQLLFWVGLNTVWLHISYGVPYALVWARLLVAAAMIPLATAVAYGLFKVLARAKIIAPDAVK